jgi:transposase
MIAITPQTKVKVYSAPINFKNGIDGIAQICRAELGEEPFSGTMFLFRNRKATSVKILIYDGQGFWLMQKRLSQGRFRHWPKTEQTASAISSREISVLLFNGDPFSTHMAGLWKKVG